MTKPTATSKSNEMLLGQLLNMVETLLRNEQAAAVSRKEIYAELEASRAAIKEIAGKLENVENDMGPIKAFKAKADKWEQRGIGAVALAGMLATAVGSVIGANLVNIKRWLGLQ